MCKYQNKKSFPLISIHADHNHKNYTEYTGCPKSHAPSLNIHISHCINYTVTNLAWMERESLKINLIPNLASSTNYTSLQNIAVERIQSYIGSFYTNRCAQKHGTPCNP